MLDSWYCRSMAANTEEDDEEEEDEEDSQEEIVNYKNHYRNLKRKLKFLIYENECFQEALRTTQRRLLKVTRDRSFLLDRLLQYEKVEATSSESEETESSDDGELMRVDPVKRKRMPESTTTNHTTPTQASASASKNVNSAKKKRPPPKTPKQNVSALQVFGNVPVSMLSDGHMTPEEVERHLESRQSYMEPVPEKALPSVPTEMFSNDPSLDSESNEIFELETSPSNMGEDCLSVDMIPE